MVRCVRLADLDYNNMPEIIFGLNTGLIFSTDLDGANSKTLYTAPSGLTGLDLTDMNNDGLPDILMGFADGSMKIAQSTGNLTWSIPVSVVTPGDSTISAGASAVPLSLDLAGKGLSDIMCGNGNGDVAWFGNNGSSKFAAKGPVNSGGLPLRLKPAISLAAGYPDGPSLPFVTMTDDSGYVYKAQAVLYGDINNDGVADILDLQQIGMHWGMIDTDPLWDGRVNLNITPGTGSVQTIDILDLQVLGRNWGLAQ
jgi:hypothetical protein